jgi:peptidoglycan L-alanyl-D-glutamate endopeptidase CwlK
MSRDIKLLTVTLQEAFSYAQAKWDEIYPNLPKPIVTTTHRTIEEQNELYAQGRTKPGKIITNAKGGQSKHNKMPAEAFDIAFKNGNDLDWNLDLFKKFADIIKVKFTQIEWGGDWKGKLKDAPHFQI